VRDGSNCSNRNLWCRRGDVAINLSRSILQVEWQFTARLFGCSGNGSILEYGWTHKKRSLIVEQLAPACVLVCSIWINLNHVQVNVGVGMASAPKLPSIQAQHGLPNDSKITSKHGLPSVNQTWHWKINYVYRLFSQQTPPFWVISQPCFITRGSANPHAILRSGSSDRLVPQRIALLWRAVGVAWAQTLVTNEPTHLVLS